MKKLIFQNLLKSVTCKVGSYTQLSGFMMVHVCEYLRPMPFLDLGPRPFMYEN